MLLYPEELIHDTINPHIMQKDCWGYKTGCRAIERRKEDSFPGIWKKSMILMRTVMTVSLIMVQLYDGVHKRKLDIFPKFHNKCKLDQNSLNSNTPYCFPGSQPEPVLSPTTWWLVVLNSGERKKGAWTNDRHGLEEFGAIRVTHANTRRRIN